MQSNIDIFGGIISTMNDIGSKIDGDADLSKISHNIINETLAGKLSTKSPMEKAAYDLVFLTKTLEYYIIRQYA